MTEEESKNALFKLHCEYMSHTQKERLKLYDEYIEKRNQIKNELRLYKAQNSNENSNIKKVA